MARTRFLRNVIAGCTLALLAAASARGQAIHIPVRPVPGPKVPVKPMDPRFPALGPVSNQHIGNAQNALLTMAQQLDEIATVKCDTDRSAVVAAWGTVVQTQRDLWSTEMQAALEAGKLHMKKLGKVDAAMIASLNTQISAQLNFINSAFGTGGGMLAEWKLDFNQRMAMMATMEKTMPVIFKQLTTDMDLVHQKLKDIQAGLDRPETSPTTAQDMMSRLDALKTQFDRVTRVVGLRQKVVFPYVQASAYPELKKKLEPILNLITPEQVAQNPSLASLPAEVIQILLKWKTLLPKQCEDTYNPVWSSAKKAVEWVTDHKKLWQSLPFFREASTFDSAGSLLTRAKAAAKEKLDNIKARWSLLDTINDFKKTMLRGRAKAEGMRTTMASQDPTKTLLDIARKVKEAAEKAERAGGAFPEAKKFIEEQALLVRERASLMKSYVDAISSPDGREYDEIIAKVAQAQDKDAAQALWLKSLSEICAKRREVKQFVEDNADDMLKLIDEGKLLLTLMQ
ncbi:MAG TPA: hypothetical protein VNE39_25845 [Planctomycetota bacterium]|nr:hypothetical protein [Planctomycetota bacterium]